MNADWRNRYEVALDAAFQAGQFALQHFDQDIAVQWKADQSPVTIADQGAEQLLRTTLLGKFPSDGFLGEESGTTPGSSGYRWIIDPIDGTRDFLRGIPLWSNLVALEAENEVVVGVCHLAGQGELFWAARGQGAFVETRGGSPRRLAASAIDRRDQAVVCVSTFNSLARHPLRSAVLDYVASAWAVRSISGCYEAMLVASGRAEAWIELEAASWDLAALQVIAEEAGARFFNFDGGRSPHGRNCVICAPGLEQDLRALVRPGGP
jgi:histidinol phosphatase-like enzyme (inositol monophosphatase family)